MLSAFGSRAWSSDDLIVENLINDLENLERPIIAEWSRGPVDFLPFIREPGQGVDQADRNGRQSILALIDRGAEVVPVLVTHLEDRRTLRGDPWRLETVGTYYDFNRNPRCAPPFGASLGAPPEMPAPQPYRLTVGDVCAEIVGQIVNRSFETWDDVPGSGLRVSSLRLSPKTRIQFKTEWGGLTRDAHRRSLIADFRHPDHELRRQGAYFRLCHYYPEEVEKLVLEELVRPAYDIRSIKSFCRERLYRDATPEELRREVAGSIEKHGKAFGAGLREQLFHDLLILDREEKSEATERTFRRGATPRRVLVEVFDYGENVTWDDRPLCEEASTDERSRLIGCLTFEESPAIRDAVVRLLEAGAQDPDRVENCLRCLANRGVPELLIRHIDDIDRRAHTEEGKGLRELEAIATSRDPLVRARLKTFLATTRDETYALAAAEALTSDEERAFVLKRIRELLAALPVETEKGGSLLAYIIAEFPEAAIGILTDFLTCRDLSRLRTIHDLCTHGEVAVPPVVLAPFLDDKRVLIDGGFAGFSYKSTVQSFVVLEIADRFGIDVDPDISEKAYLDLIEQLRARCRELSLKQATTP